MILFVYWFMITDEPEDVTTIDADKQQTQVRFAYPNINFLLKLFLAAFLYMIITGICMGILLVVCDELFVSLPYLKPLMNFIAYVVSQVLTIRYALKQGKKLEDHPYKVSFNRVKILLIPVLILSTLALVVGLERVGALIPMPSSVQKFFEKMVTKDIFSIITLVVAAPILEEILCRGIVLRGLLKNYSPQKAIVISAIFFGALHMNPWQALPAFMGGLFLGWTYYKTQSVIPGMIIHATINSTAVLFLFLPTRQQSFLGLLGLPYYITLCAIAILIFTAGCLIIHKKTANISA